MGLLSDKEIIERVENSQMIEPFHPHLVRQDAEGNKIISYGLSSYGYDLRVDRKFKVFTNVFCSSVDPKGFKEKEFETIGNMICDVLEGFVKNGEEGNHQLEEKTKAEVRKICENFPIY